MLASRFCFALTLGTSFLIPDPASAQTLALTNANVVDVQSGEISTGRTIIVEGKFIRRITGPGESPPRGARIVNLNSGYVIPGLWDMHAHIGATGRSSLDLYIANGVTGVRDMGSLLRTVRPWKDSIESGQLLGPRLILSSPIIENSSWLETVRAWAKQSGDSALVEDLAGRIPVNTPATARQAVDSAVSLRADFIKVRNDPSPVALFALLRHAREKNIPVTGHWPSRISPAEASDSGYRSLEHGALSSGNGQFGPTLARMSPDERGTLFARFVRNKTAFTATTISGKGFRLTPDSVIARLLADSTGSIEPRMRYVDRKQLAGWKADFALKAQERPPLDWPAFHKTWLGDIREMADANVLLLAGTDAGSPLVFTGFAIADELISMVKDAGLTPLQSLQTATLNVAKWMNAEQSFGTVAVGRRADLVVLDGNPLDDISNVSRVRFVIRDGRVLNRTTLDSLLERVAAAARISKPALAVIDTSYSGTVDRAYAAIDAAQWSTAIPLWQKVLAINPYIADHWYGLGRSFYNSGDRKSSIPAFRRAFELGGGRQYNAAFNVARAYAHESSRDSALTWLKRSLELGYRSRATMRDDPEFEKYRNDPLFKHLTDSTDVSKLSLAEGRKHDLEFMVAEVRRMHVDPDKTMRFGDFEHYVRNLIPRAGSLTDNQFSISIMRALGMIGSGHTGPTPESMPAWGGKAVPLQFFDFADGLRIVAADSVYTDLVGALVTHVGNREIATVRASFDSVMSKDHPLGGRAPFTRWLRYPQTSNGLGLISSGDSLPLSVVTASGTTRAVNIPTRVTGNGYGRFIGRPEWIQAHLRVSGEVPLYLQNREKPYWYAMIPSERTMYMGFNSVRNAPDEPLEVFVQRMFESADSANAQRLVIDLRWNYGGNTGLVTPLLRGIMARERFVKRGGLFVIIGRITNSAAQNATTLLERYLNPITVGEVSGSAPNFVGEDNFITLPYSRISVGISDLYWQASWAQDERIWTAPNLLALPTWEAYRAGRDPAMEAIRSWAK